MTIIKKLSSFLGNLTQKEVKVATSGNPQGYVLAERMRHEKIEHDETVLADLEGVRIDEKGNVKFCPLQGVKVSQRISPGDGSRRLPIEVEFKEIKRSVFTRPGWYNLKNVLLHANGVITVTPTNKTKWESVSLK